MILFDDVYKNYPNGTNALNGVSFEIKDGEFVFIIGPSGAGKSTMIKLLLREERHSSGKIIVNDFNLNKMKSGKIPMLRLPCVLSGAVTRRYAAGCRMF